MTKFCEQVNIKDQQIVFTPPKKLQFYRNTALSTVGCFHSILSCVKISCKRICCRSQTKCCYAFNTFKGIRHYGYAFLRSSCINGKSGKTLEVQVSGYLKNGIVAGKMLEDFLELCAPHSQGRALDGGWSRSCVCSTSHCSQHPLSCSSSTKWLPLPLTGSAASLFHGFVCRFPPLKLLAVLQDPVPASPFL